MYIDFKPHFECNRCNLNFNYQNVFFCITNFGALHETAGGTIIKGSMSQTVVIIETSIVT